MLATALLLVSTVAILHAAFSTYEHLSHLKAIGRPEGSLPFDIVLEAFFALILGTVGASLNAPKLKEITWAAEMRNRFDDRRDVFQTELRILRPPREHVIFWSYIAQVVRLSEIIFDW
ncbi:unnamed protein product [Mycena citricolor]|uniref:Membrane magnesium transporter n=1 Tax=Mycena citricolor TaxID=2018698 RepID=A0AAD2Q259_9AGAR|nr:unnamed protein product [Mycena citricolor]CAK5283118.1 unnamed protein product [Mycena citricolor]